MVTLYISRPGAEEFLEVECRVFYILKSGKGLPEIKGEDIETRQACIRIRIAEVIDVPFCLCSLLHYIVPGVDFIFRVVFKKVEWSTGKVEYVSICLGKKFYDVLTEFGLGTFVSLINDEHIIFSLEDR